MKTITILKILTFLLFVCPATCLFGNSLKKLKQKAKNAYKKKFGKDKQAHFLGHDLTEYPGTNDRFRRVNKEKWDDYYDCLLEINSSVSEELSHIPEAILGYEANSISFKCQLCISPSESSKRDSVEWEWAPAFDKTLQPIDYTEHVLVSPEDRTLRMYNLQKEHTGQYMCRIGEAQAPPFFLTVIPTDDNNFREVHSSSSPKGPYAQGVRIISGTELILDTEWGPYTPCNKCKQIGRKHKLGYCIIKHKENSDNTRLTNVTENIARSVTVTPATYELLRIFKFGIPCKSYILPMSLRKLQEVKHWTNEIMTAFCKEDCPEEQVFEVRDKDGKVIESANNSAGIYSMLQGAPPLEPSVERLLIFADLGKDVVLTCPGNLNSDMPVTWQIGPKKIVPEALVAASKGRIFISITDKIHIKKARTIDSNIYSCWQHNDLAGTVRLIVEKNVSLNFNHHLMLYGMVIVFATFLYVFTKAFFGRKTVQKRLQ